MISLAASERRLTKAPGFRLLYLIGETVTIPLTAWLSRIFGVRWYLLANVVLFLVFSMLCGISHSLAEMIIFRAAQGFTGGVMIPMSFTVLLQTLPKSKQPVGLALFGITATLAPAIGPTVGGFLTDSFGWPMVFYVNLIPGAVMLIAILYSIDRQRINLSLFRNGDWWGIICMAIGLGALVVMLEEGQRGRLVREPVHPDLRGPGPDLPSDFSYD